MFSPKNPEFWVMISFICFAGLLIYYGIPGLIGKALDKRADGIRNELDEARRLRQEAQDLLADYQRKARAAEDEAKAIVDAAKKEADSIAADSRVTLKETLERRTKLAEDKIARAEAQAIAEVRAAAVEKATTAAEKVLATKIVGDRAQTMIDASIRDLKGRIN